MVDDSVTVNFYRLSSFYCTGTRSAQNRLWHLPTKTLDVTVMLMCGAPVQYYRASFLGPRFVWCWPVTINIRWIQYLDAHTHTTSRLDLQLVTNICCCRKQGTFHCHSSLWDLDWSRWQNYSIDPALFLWTIPALFSTYILLHTYISLNCQPMWHKNQQISGHFPSAETLTRVAVAMLC